MRFFVSTYGKIGICENYHRNESSKILLHTSTHIIYTGCLERSCRQEITMRAKIMLVLHIQTFDIGFRYGIIRLESEMSKN